jgi:hypothetical protein
MGVGAKGASSKRLPGANDDAAWTTSQSKPRFPQPSDKVPRPVTLPVEDPRESGPGGLTREVETAHMTIRY